MCSDTPYPHMTVRDNMGFSLKLRKKAGNDHEGVAKAAKILTSSRSFTAIPQALGRAAQRVAMAAPSSRPRCSVRRAALQPRAKLAWRCAPRSRRCTALKTHGVRHARPGDMTWRASR